MKTKLLRSLTIAILTFLSANLIYGQTVGSTFKSTDGKMIYTVTAVGSPNTVSVKRNGTPTGEINIPDSVIDNSVTYSVTSIESYAFSYCNGLTSVTIGGRMMSIGSYAFTNCNGITLLTLGSGVKSIGQYAFKECNGLTAVNFNASNCDDLTYTSISSTGSVFAVTIGSNVMRVPASLFSGCSKVGSVVFDGTPKCAEIGNRAFIGCNGLTSITIPNSVTNIGIQAFSFCIGLTSITIPNSATSIGNGAFAGCNCSFIVDATNPNYSVVDDILYNKDQTKLIQCPIFKTGNFVIPTSVKNIGEFAFVGCSGLTSIPIPNTITSIGNWVFGGCSGLTSVTIPNSVTSIGDGVFSDCSGLTSVIIPNSVTSIGMSAFQYCIGLTSVTLPNSITTIGNYAFYVCSGLSAIILQNSSPPTLGGLSVFSNMTSRAKLYVPFGTKSVYNTNFGASFDQGDNIIEGTEFYTEGGIKYVITDPINKKMTVVENLPAYTGSITVPAKVSYNSQLYSVSAIGNDAFSTCNGLTSVSIPNSVISVGNYAFKGSVDLTSTTIPNSVAIIGVNAFQGCTGLTSITIPDSVDSIGTNVFQGCTGLTSCTMGKFMKHIGEYAFQGCTGLNSVTIPDSVSSVGANAFQGCTGMISCSIGKSMKNIGTNAFQGCNSLTSIIIPDSVDSIRTNAFSDCSSITSVILGSSLINIAANAFQYCTKLTSITIPESVISIGDNAFQGCTGMTSINFNAVNCNSMGSSNNYTNTMVFFGCTSLTTLTIGDKVKRIPSYAFPRCSTLTSVSIGKSLLSIGDYAFHSCAKLALKTIPDSVTSIGKLAFYGCVGLTDISFGKGVQTIGNYAFYGCTGLTSVSFNATNCTTMGDYYSPVFKGCTKLANLTIGNNVTILPNSAFNSCSKLATITMQTPTPPTLIGNSVFFGISSGAILYVPQGSKTDYMNYNTNSTYTNFFSSAGSTTDGARIIESITAVIGIDTVNACVNSNRNRQIVINSNDVLRGKVSVYNMAGQWQTGGRLEGLVTVLSKHLTSGPYLVIVDVDGRIKNEKVIVY
ncbi:MAG: leucine-rich repeat domain-containing protein [Paludibacter sp.]|nr:leucine-rich repeat domain-containing protein [Paludibacter sp.]